MTESQKRRFVKKIKLPVISQQDAELKRELFKARGSRAHSLMNQL